MLCNCFFVCLFFLKETDKQTINGSWNMIKDNHDCSDAVYPVLDLCCFFLCLVSFYSSFIKANQWKSVQVDLRLKMAALYCKLFLKQRCNAFFRLEYFCFPGSFRCSSAAFAQQVPVLNKVSLKSFVCILFRAWSTWSLWERRDTAFPKQEPSKWWVWECYSITLNPLFLVFFFQFSILWAILCVCNKISLHCERYSC